MTFVATMLVYCWASVGYGRPALGRQLVNVSCLLVNFKICYNTSCCVWWTIKRGSNIGLYIYHQISDLHFLLYNPFSTNDNSIYLNFMDLYSSRIMTHGGMAETHIFCVYLSRPSVLINVFLISCVHHLTPLSLRADPSIIHRAVFIYRPTPRK